jgi:hypothetical protein
MEPGGPIRAPQPRRESRKARLPAAEWASWDDERLLDLRLCDLDVRIEGSDLEPRIAELNGELEAQGIRFRPHFYLADEWFCPDGVPGSPSRSTWPTRGWPGSNSRRCWRWRAARGSGACASSATRRACARERLQAATPAGAAGDLRQELEPYPDHYAPKPYQQELRAAPRAWYAQSHPDEDFAETFAVWLTPGRTGAPATRAGRRCASSSTSTG